MGQQCRENLKHNGRGNTTVSRRTNIRETVWERKTNSEMNTQRIFTNINIEGGVEVRGWLELNLSSQLWYCLVGLVINGLQLRLADSEADSRSGNLVAQRRLYWLDDQPGLSCVAIGPSCIELGGGRCRFHGGGVW